MFGHIHGWYHAFDYSPMAGLLPRVLPLVRSNRRFVHPVAIRRAAYALMADDSSSAGSVVRLDAEHLDELRTWVNSTDTFLLDCDGVLWRASDGLPGVAHTVEVLRKCGKQIFFVSNNSTKSREDYVHKLETIAGITCDASEVISSAYAAAVWCRQHGITKKVYCLGMKGLVSELESAGLEVLGPGDHEKSFSFGTFEPSFLDSDVEAVVAGFDGNMSYYKVAMAASYLRYKPHTKFVATNRDATFPDTHMMIPGGGIVIAAIEQGSGRSPDVVAGKPSMGMLEILQEAFGIDRSKTCMVGDRLDTDIVFGAKGGLASRLLVLTGVSHMADVAKFPVGDAHVPTHVASSFGEIGKLIEAAGILR